MSEQAEWQYELWRLNPDGTETRLHTRHISLEDMCQRAEFLHSLHADPATRPVDRHIGQRYVVRDRTGQDVYTTEVVR